MCSRTTSLGWSCQRCKAWRKALACASETACCNPPPSPLGKVCRNALPAATAKLRSIGVPAGDLYCVLHPAIAYDLKANLTATYANPNAGVIQNEAMAMGYLGMLAGVPVYETSNINNNGTAGDFVGGLFHRDALGLAMMQDIKIETQRDASLRADEIVATAMYGHGVLYESYGVALGFDSSIL